MYSNLTKNIEKIFLEFCNLSKATKNSIKYGTQISLVLLLAGAGLIYYNHQGMNYDSYFELIATSVVKAGFTTLAIVIIGSLLVEYIFKQK